MEKIYSVTANQFKEIKKFFRGYIFNRKDGDENFVKVNSDRDKIIVEQLIKKY